MKFGQMTLTFTSRSHIASGRLVECSRPVAARATIASLRPIEVAMYVVCGSLLEALDHAKRSGKRVARSHERC